MSSQMFNERTRSITQTWLLLTGLLLVTACDGGIFGTGGPDDPLIATDMSGSGSPNTEDSIGTSVDAGDTGSTDASGTTDGTEGVDSADAGTTGGGTDSGSTDGGTTGAGTTDGGTGSGATDDGTTTANVGTGDDSNVGNFVNEQQTLAVADSKLNIVNVTDNIVNVADTSAVTTEMIFGEDGIAPGTVSNTVSLARTESVLDIVDNTRTENSLYLLNTLRAVESTFTTLVLRQSGSEYSVLPLITEVSTSDNMNARVRVVQASSLGNENDVAVFSMMSAGANPGGVDRDFGPLSFGSAVTAYEEVPAGDYELVDSLNRFSAQGFTVGGGNVYTMLITGNSPDAILIVNDTAAAD